MAQAFVLLILIAIVFPQNFSALFFQGFRPPPPQKFTPKLVSIPLQFHFLEPKIYSRRFSAYGGLVARFARIDSHDSRESPDSRESETRVIRANRPDALSKKGSQLRMIRTNRIANRPCH